MPYELQPPIVVPEKPHAVLGASSFQTWGVCPGSIALGEDLPKSTSSYAKEGTAAHALLEMCLIEKFDAEEAIGQVFVVEGEQFTVDHDMADAINSSIDVIQSYMGEDGVLLVEQQVSLTHMTGEEGAVGTLDIGIVKDKGTTLVIIDFKYGQGVMVYASEPLPTDPPSVKPNGQVGMYGSGFIHDHGFMYENIEKIVLVVLQPRMEWTDEYTITLAQLGEFEDVVREAAGQVELNRVVKAEGNTLDLVPGEKQCKFCKAKGVCPALREHTSKSLATIAEPSKLSDFEDLSLPKQAAAVVVNEGVTNEQLAEFMRAVPLIEEAVAAAGEETLRRLTAGQEIPGFYLGIGRAGRRKWASDEQAKTELTRSGRMKVADACEQVVKSPTQIEKLAKNTRWWPKVAPLIVQPPGGPKICKDGDTNPRYAIASDVKEFANLDEPATIAKVFAAQTQNGWLVETSDGQTIVLDPKDREAIKLAVKDAPVAPLQELLASRKAVPALEDIMG